MWDFVARENIKRFEHILLRTTEQDERIIVLKMLAAEKAELAAIEAAHLRGKPER